MTYADLTLLIQSLLLLMLPSSLRTQPSTIRVPQQQAQLYFPQKLSEGIHEVNISAKGNIASTFMRDEFRFWDISTGKLLSRYRIPDTYATGQAVDNYCEMVPDGSGILYAVNSGFGSPELQFWNREGSQLIQLTNGKEGYFSDDGSALFVKKPDFSGQSEQYLVTYFPLQKQVLEEQTEARLPVQGDADLIPLIRDPLQLLVLEMAKEGEEDAGYRVSLIDFNIPEKQTFNLLFKEKPKVQNMLTTQPIIVLDEGNDQQSQLKLLDYERGKFLRDLGNYPGRIVSSELSENEQYLYSLLHTGEIMRQDLSTDRPPELIMQVELYRHAGTLVETCSPLLMNTPAGLICLFKSAANQLEAWNIERQEKVWEQEVHTIAQRNNDQLDHILPFEPPGRAPAVLIANKEGDIYVRDLYSGRIITFFEYGYPVEIRAASFTGDHELLLESRDHKWLFDLQTSHLQELSDPPNPFTTYQAMELPDGRKLELSNGGFLNPAAIRIIDSNDGALLAEINLLNEQEWVVMKPGGLFDASPGAMSLLYYVVDLEIIELAQLKGRYYEPGLLQKILGYSRESLRSVEGLEQIDLYPKVNAAITDEQLQVQLEKRDGGIGQVSVFINGKEIVQDANPDRKEHFSFDLNVVRPYLLRHPDSTNIVSLRAFNEAGWLKGPSVTLAYRPRHLARGNGAGQTSGWQASLDPKMYVVTIGTSDYNGDQLDLKYAAQDAVSMAKALQAVGANLFADGDSIEVYCLSTSQTAPPDLEGTPIAWQFASKKNIQGTLRQIRHKAKAEDVLLVYLSGHGLTYGSSDAAQFYYLTHHLTSEEMISDTETRKLYTVSTEELTEWINAVAALKQVLVIDACHSGKVIENLTSMTRSLNSSQIRALDRMKDRTGMFILSGSAADKVSYEASEYGQGLLTYSLLQGMLGVATRRTADGDYVDIMKLFQHARDEVPRLAASINGIQTPMLGFPSSGASFDIGIVTDQSSIPIGQKKSVIIRSVFLNQHSLDDDLGLIQLLEQAFREETEEGADADLIYVDTNEYLGAYSVKGLYWKEGDTIKIKVKLFGGTEPKELEIPPTDDPKRLVRLIVREVKRVLR